MSAPLQALRIEIDGPPVPCARARTVRNKKTGAVHSFTPKTTAAYKERVQWCAMAAMGKQRWTFSVKDRFSITIMVYCAEERGDFDNYSKALTDPLKGIAWADDTQVKHAEVFVEVDRIRPRAIVLVKKIEWSAPKPLKKAR